MTAVEGTFGDLPVGYEPVPHQVAGHMYKDGKHGMLRRSGGSEKQLYKPVQSPPKGQREVDFYAAINQSGDAEPVWSEFRKWMARFYGTTRLPDQLQYIALEDLVSPYDNPSVIDIKVGQRCWDNFASDEKIRSEREKYPPQAKIGYRIGGIRRFVADDQTSVKRSKTHCLTLDEQGVKDALKEFFSGCKDGLEDVIKQLQMLSSLFEKQTSVHFFSSSLLIIFGTSDAQQPPACVRMIDFAHAYMLSEDEASVDDNYLFGLRNLVKTLSEL
ncbi:inositol polyphosphate multikinase-like [Sycon ciliatum]|uniref:inositol polyphosphate multikinase-like n=1 Tax=Sycon ciliatum TaxID=27933 RepID=UPI0020AD3A6B|eukprot:scpid93182/ scgid27301/ Inositol polyphosphate multikinase; Inositol 1,3,4,6-tetrakisphosphate 5-kinase